jgi:hypothetical protein
MLALATDRASLELRVSCLVAGMTQCNEVIRMVLSKENVSLLLEQPAMLTVVVHDMVKFYGNNKDFDHLTPAISHILQKAAVHSNASAYAVTEICHMLL